MPFNIVNAIPLIFGIVANSLALVVIYKGRRRTKSSQRGRSVPSFFVHTLVTVDLMSLVVLLIGRSIDIEDTELECEVNYVTRLTVGYASGFMNTLMCLERCFALRAPFYYHRMATLCKAKIAVFVVLSLSFLINTLPVMGVGSYAVKVGNTTEVKCNPPGESGILSSPGDRAFTAIYLAFGVLMLILMYVSNGVVIFQLRQLKRRARSGALKSSEPKTGPSPPRPSTIEMRTSYDSQSDVSPIDPEKRRTNFRSAACRNERRPATLHHSSRGRGSGETTRTSHERSISKIVVVMSVVFTISWFPFYVMILSQYLILFNIVHNETVLVTRYLQVC
ncbi:prostaglandin E2 receptor EP3 subtype-like [Diadema antillarum]|uniref:prostaglandin E2 receptor EP3 subtype-like n=1 Tax=Diadema antillarum TaxID=105358 RepID=UPI003A8A4C93